MYEELDGINPPNDKDVLWRYTNFEVFVNLLDTEALYFTRADKFEDPYEGFIPAKYYGRLQTIPHACYLRTVCRRRYEAA